MPKPIRRMLLTSVLIALVGFVVLRIKTKGILAVAVTTEPTRPAASSVLYQRSTLNSRPEFHSTPSVPEGQEPAARPLPSAPRQVSMPLVFQQFNRDLWKLTDEQVEVIDDLRTSFLEQIGGLDQNPNDPVYLDKWQKAQPECDAMLWAKLGKDFFQEAQLQAYASASFAARGE